MSDKKHLSNRNNKYRFMACLMVLLWSGAVSIAKASIGAYDFESEEKRSRYQLIVKELRCPKCQNQNLSDSNSQIAIDLRDEVARMVKEAKTDDEIKKYMVDRYGDFVLYRPPVQNNTLVLWWAPVVMMVTGLLIFATIIFRRRRASVIVTENEGDKEESQTDSKQSDTEDTNKTNERG